MIPSVISTWNELLVKAIMVFDRYSGAPFTKNTTKSIVTNTTVLVGNDTDLLVPACDSMIQNYIPSIWH